MNSKPEVSEIHYDNGWKIICDPVHDTQKCYDTTGKEVPLPGWAMDSEDSDDMDIDGDAWPIDKIVEIDDIENDDDDDDDGEDLKSSRGRIRKTSRWTGRKSKD